MTNYLTYPLLSIAIGAILWIAAIYIGRWLWPERYLSIDLEDYFAEDTYEHQRKVIDDTHKKMEGR